MSLSEPSKILTPWATSGLKNTIPSAADPVTGKAGYDQGFPAINMTAKEAGGIPPFGQDFNGIFFDITQILQYMQAGGHPTYSAALSTAIGGYPLGAMLAKASGLGFWRNITANNTTNPDSGGIGWVSDSVGGYANATVVTASSTTLTPVQVGQAFLFTTASSTVALPAASSIASGGAYKLHTSAGIVLSVTGGGLMQAGNSSVTSLAVPAGTELLAVSSGTSWWVFGTGVIVNSAIFTFSKAPNGWRKGPDGIIEQWGSVTISSGTGSVTVSGTWPIPFPNRLFSVSFQASGGTDIVAPSGGTASYTLSGFNTAVVDSRTSSGGIDAQTVYFRAIGD